MQKAAALRVEVVLLPYLGALEVRTRRNEGKRLHQPSPPADLASTPLPASTWLVQVLVSHLFNQKITAHSRAEGLI